MSLSLERTYIGFLATRFERFSWIRSDLATCRCPICHEGRSKTKRRFYFYVNKYTRDSYNVECKNCGYSRSFYNFLNEQDPGLFQEYRKESFKEYYGSSWRERKPLEKREEEPKPTLTKRTLGDAVAIRDLPEDHYCRMYVAGRMIPEKYWDSLFYHNDFKVLAEQLVDEEHHKNLPSGPRLVIPGYDSYGNLKFVQGRSLEQKPLIRYITIKMNDQVDKVYGEERVNRSREVRVCEGPIDSLFVENCLASCDSDLLKVRGDVYIPDNQYRNRDICFRIQKMIDAGVKVVLFPPSFTYKDINDAVKIGGMSVDQIEQLIKENTFQGLSAKLKFSQLKKI